MIVLEVALGIVLGYFLIIFILNYIGEIMIFLIWAVLIIVGGGIILYLLTLCSGPICIK